MAERYINVSAIEGVAPSIIDLDAKCSFTPRLPFSTASHCMIGATSLRTGLKFLANEDVLVSADNRTPVIPASMFVTMLSYLLFSNVRFFRLLLYFS